MTGTLLWFKFLRSIALKDAIQTDTQTSKTKTQIRAHALRSDTLSFLSFSLFLNNFPVSLLYRYLSHLQCLSYPHDSRKILET